MLLLQFLSFPLVCWAVQDNASGCLWVPHPGAAQGMGCAKARGGQQLVLAWLGCCTQEQCQHSALRDCLAPAVEAARQGLICQAL